MALLQAQFDRWFQATQQWGPLSQAHSSIFRLTCLLVEEGRPDEQVLQITRNACRSIQRRPVPERELVSALNYAKQGTDRVVQRWALFDPALRSEIAKTASLADLKAASPQFPHTGEEALAALFPGDPLICMGQTVDRFKTGPLSKWKGLSNGQFVVPNPMTTPLGKTMDGRPSARTNSNTGPRTYQVVEFDTGTFDTHAAILLHLSTEVPLVMAVYSGSKSLHGWFRVKGMTAAAQREFFESAVRLGADHRMWTPSQFSRLPLGRNSRTNKAQEVFYFNP